jgi:hypothetical protein
MFKQVAFLIIFIVILGLIVFSKPSNLSNTISESFTWNKPADSEDNRKQVVILPNLDANVHVYYDIEIGSIYIIEGNLIKVIPRETTDSSISNLKQYNIMTETGISDLNNISGSSISSETKNNTWVYIHKSKENGDVYITYKNAESGKTRFADITISSTSDSGQSQITFYFGNETKPVDLSERSPVNTITVENGQSSTNDLSIVGIFVNEGKQKYYRRIETIDDVASGTVTWKDGTSGTAANINIILNVQYTKYYIGERVYIQIETEYNEENGKEDYHYLSAVITTANNDDTYNVNYAQDEMLEYVKSKPNPPSSENISADKIHSKF